MRNTRCVTVHQSEGIAPTFDQADRMRKALRVADMGVAEMADYLGVARNTVSNWINGRIHPSTQTMRLWALRTGVSFDWLQTGVVSTNGDGPSGQSSRRQAVGGADESRPTLAYRHSSHLRAA